MALKVDFQDKLLRGEGSLCVWGLGYIGFSALAYYAHKGIDCVGYDLNPEVEKKIRAGECPARGLDLWLKINGMTLALPSLVTSKLEDLESIKSKILVYKICIPTEERGLVSDKYLAETARAIATLVKDVGHQVLIDVESTISPHMIDVAVVPHFKDNPNVLISASPRRDWFISSEKDLRRIPRIVGGVTEDAGEAARQVNAIVCNDVIVASSHRTASATKAVENALRNVAINVVNEMARGLSIDVREVCRLAASKWNIDLYEPSIGIGGYCIPLGPGYLTADRGGGPMSLLDTAVQETKYHIKWVSGQLAALPYKKYAFLGLSYRGDVPVYKMSPPVEIANALADCGKDVVVSDLYASEDDLNMLFGKSAVRKVKVSGFPSCLEGAEVVVAGPAHGEYRCIPTAKLFSALKSCKKVVDNEGVFAHVPAKLWTESGIRYSRPGENGWMD